MRTMLSLSIAVFAVANICDAQSLSKSEILRVNRAIIAVGQEQEAIGAAIGVLRGGRIAYVQAYGYSDREKMVEASTETIFNWASNSKPVMAILALKLVDQGKLDLDADVRTYVPEFPEKDGIITTRHLLCHQSGIVHYNNGSVIGISLNPHRDRELVSPLRAIKQFDRSPLLFAPGSKVSYSSYAYVLLSAVVERAGGRDLQSQLESEIIKPLKLTSLTLDYPEIQDSWATGYRRDKKSKKVQRTGEYPHYWKYGAGAYKSNIQDFARWSQALLNGELLSPDTQRLMYTQQQLSDGTKTERGLGITVELQNRSWKLSHNGQQDEARTRLVLYPDAKHGVVVMSNCEFVDPGKFSSAVYDALKSN